MCCVSAHPAPAADLSDRELIQQLVTQADAGETPFALAQSIGERGMSAALVAAELLDEQKPRRSQLLLEAIATAGTCRRSHAELLRIYQPAAHELFHTTNGLAGQQRLAVALGWRVWPAALPEAVVRAAPLPLIDWLRAQAASAMPALDKLRHLAQPLGNWLRARNERQHTHAFHAAIAALTANPAITRDASTCGALLRLIADASATGSLEFVLQHLRVPQAEVRADAVVALGQLLSPQSHGCGRGCGPTGVAEWNRLASARTQALAEFVRLAGEEPNVTVQTKVAAAAEAWPEEARVGAAMRQLFQRTGDAGVRRAILFSVANTRWPQLAQVILAGFDAPADGVLGVALQAVAAHPLPDLAPRTLAMLDDFRDVQPMLIDAVGALANPAATPALLRWLERERNVAVRLKLALALERIPGDSTARGLATMLAREAEPLLGEHLCRIASRRELPGAAATLAALAEDATAPLPVRGQAVWALGRYAEPVARECLARLRSAPEKYFSATPTSASGAEPVEHARLLIALASLRAGGPDDEVARRFAAGSPADQLTCLLSLAELKRDHPIIGEALGTGDFAVLLGAVKAAGAAAPEKYAARLRGLREAPFVAALLASGLDTWGLPATFATALREGGGR
ncbi:MAG: hypothetical protein B9S33_13975 [Pedosphaera sp. Tous-C6FEB]|nr:MAG: hypothetical protein B9S33_13975 [Pedosphaera sp. Tous-C6FEB]